MVNIFKNDYIEMDDYFIIYLDRRNKSRLECMVSKEDFYMIITFEFKWHAMWMKNSKSYYAGATVNFVDDDGARWGKSVMMHRFLFDLPTEHGGRSKLTVDHLNHDTLDNRRGNIILSNHSKNALNRISKNTNNTSGYRNVCWNKSKEKWMVQLQINGKNTKLGYFDDVDEAGKFALKMRAIYYK